MEQNFWHQKWAQNEIGFHEGKPNAMLLKYFQKLHLESGLESGGLQGARIFLPLCGKTRDIAWLLSQGFRVAGAELSETAVKQLFSESGLEPRVSKVGEHLHYSAENLDIFVGDIFALSAEQLGTVDAVYDRAALVALPVGMRRQYVAHLLNLTNTVPQLLLTFDYDQSLMGGPPFSVTNDEIRQHYAAHYDMQLLETLSVPGGLKGVCDASENVWLLQHG